MTEQSVYPIYLRKRELEEIMYHLPHDSGTRRFIQAYIDEHVLITGEWSRLLVLTFNVLGITLIQDLVMLYQDRTRYKRFFQYALFNFYVLLPLWPVALFTIDDTGWGTR